VSVELFAPHLAVSNIMFSPSSDKSVSHIGAVPKKRAIPRVAVLLVLGIVLIGSGFAVRNSPWAKERRLSTLSEDALSYAVHDDPYDALTFLYYGSALLKSGNVPASEKAFQRACELDSKMARAYDGLGSAQMRLGKTKSANEAFQQAVKLDSKDVAGYLGLSQTFHQSGSTQRAIAPLKKLVDLEPKNSVAWYHLGRLYGEDHQADLAYAALQKAVALDGKNADYWRDLGHLSMHYGKTQDAETQLTRALQITPNDAVAHFLLGQLYAQMGDKAPYYTQAEREFKTALARDPQMSEGYFELGQLYERHRDYSVAITNYRKACELNDSDDRPLYHLGSCLVKTGQRVEGEAKLRGAQALRTAKKEVEDLQNRSLTDPQNPILHLRMARVWRKYGNDEDALREYRAYKALGPPDPAVEQEIEMFIRAEQRTDRGGSPAGPGK